MDYFEEVMKYKIGIETEIISIEEFSKFIDNEMSRLDNIPDIYIEVALHINKGVKELLSAISEYCYENRLKLTEEQEDKIKKYLLNIVKDKYLSKKIDMKECTHCISKVGLYFEPLSTLANMEYYYDISADYPLSTLANMEYYYDISADYPLYTLEKIDSMIREIFENL